MGNNTTLEDNVVGLGEEMRLFAITPAGEWVAVSADATGQLQAALDAETIGLLDSADARIDPATEATLAAIAGALASNGADTLQVEQQSAVAVEDSSGAEINPDEAPDYPANETTGHDLVGGDLVLGPVSVARAQAVMISATSTDVNAWSASVEWSDGDGNTFVAESKTEIGLDTKTADWARLTRKGPNITVTFTDESSLATNIINAFVGAHR